jgi:hypothetical protein
VRRLTVNDRRYKEEEGNEEPACIGGSMQERSKSEGGGKEVVDIYVQTPAGAESMAGESHVEVNNEGRRPSKGIASAGEGERRLVVIQQLPF